MAKAKAIEEKLKNNYKYDLQSPSAGTAQPVEHFLFESKRGHCEFYSTSMALLLREIGIPSRNVTGFVGGVYNRFGKYYAVRRGDAHSWVEAYIDEPESPSGGSWRTFDPTPSAGAQPTDDSESTSGYMRDLMDAMGQRWQKNVLGYDLATQMRGLRWLSNTGKGLTTAASPKRKALFGLGILATVGVVVYFMTRRRKIKGATVLLKGKEGKKAVDSSVQASELFRALESELASQGFARPDYVTPLRFADSLHTHPHAKEIRELTDLYLEARFGTMSVAKEEYLLRVARLRPQQS